MRQLDGLPGVVLAEIDGLGHVGFRLNPVFRSLQGFPGGQLKFVAAHFPGELQDGRGPLGGRKRPPARKGPPGCVQGLVRLLGGRRGHRAHHLCRPGRVEAHYFLLGVNCLSADDEGPVTAQPQAHRSQRFPVGRGPGGVGEITEWLVPEWFQHGGFL